MKAFKYLILILFSLIYINSQAQYTWEEVTLPDSIGAGSICFYNNDIYLATGNGVYHSNDNCENWEYIGLGQYPIWSIYVSTTGNLYAGTGSRFFKYAGNYQWDLLYKPDEASNILSIYESDSGYIFFGNWGGIFRSTDGGISWTEVLDLWNTEVVESITENSDGILYAGSTSIYGDSCGIYKSVNGGATWYLVGLKYHFISSVVINSDNEIYAGTNGHWTIGTGRIYKSVDNGQTWNIVFDNHYILSLSINEYDEVAAASETGIFCTYDHGLTWDNITPYWAGSYFKEVAFHPAGQLYAISHFTTAKLYRTLEPVIIQNDADVQDEIKIFPNPSNNLLLIETNNDIFDKVIISDITGKEIKRLDFQNKNPISIYVGDLQPSVYIIQLFGDKISTNFKFIKR